MKKPAKAPRFRHLNKGTCSRAVSFRVVDGRLRDVEFEGGCAGNTQGICRLLEGADPADAAKRLKGVRCGDKDTSCPDQLARAIVAWRKARA